MKRALGVFPKVVFAALGLIFVATAVFVGIAFKKANAADHYAVGYTTHNYTNRKSISLEPWYGLTHFHSINGTTAWCAQHHKTAPREDENPTLRVVKVVDLLDGNVWQNKDNIDIFEAIRYEDEGNSASNYDIFRILYYADDWYSQYNDSAYKGSFDEDRKGRDLAVHLALDLISRRTLIASETWPGYKAARDLTSYATNPSRNPNAVNLKWDDVVVYVWESEVNGESGDYQRFLTFDIKKKEETKAKLTVIKYWKDGNRPNLRPSTLSFLLKDEDGNIVKDSNGQFKSCTTTIDTRTGADNKDKCVFEDLDPRKTYHVYFEGFIGRPLNIGDEGKLENYGTVGIGPNRIIRGFEPKVSSCLKSNNGDTNCYVTNSLSSDVMVWISKKWYDRNAEKRPKKVHYYVYRKYTGARPSECLVGYPIEELKNIGVVNASDASYNGNYCLLQGLTFDAGKDFEYYDDFPGVDKDGNDIKYLVAEATGYHIREGKEDNELLANINNYDVNSLSEDIVATKDISVADSNQVMDQITLTFKKGADEVTGQLLYDFNNGVLTELKVTKKWQKMNANGEYEDLTESDYDELDEKLESINFQLARKDEKNGQVYKGAIEKGTSWRDPTDKVLTFDNLPLYKDASGNLTEWVLTEINGPEGYVSSVVCNDLKQQEHRNEQIWECVATNTNSTVEETTSASVEKVWNDADIYHPNGNDMRPNNVTVDLWQKVDGGDWKVYMSNVELNEANSWRYTWENLPKNIGDKDIHYKVEESKSNAFESEVKCSDNSEVNDYCENYSYTITNTPLTIKVNVEKIWNDSAKNDGVLEFGNNRQPVDAILLMNNEEVGRQTLNAENNWEYEWKKLPKYDEYGNVIKWDVKEEFSSDRYKSTSKTTYNEGGDVNVTLINTELVGIHIAKKWKNIDSSLAYKLPDSLMFVIYRGQKNDNGDVENWAFVGHVNYDKSYYNYKDGVTNNYYVINNYPKYDENGKQYYYKIIEVEAEDYDGEGNEGCTNPSLEEDNNYWTVYACQYTNTYDLTNIEVSKKWNDNNNIDGKRPESVIVRPEMCIGSDCSPIRLAWKDDYIEIVKSSMSENYITLELSELNDWHNGIYNLPTKYEVDGVEKEIRWDIVEEDIDGYASNVSVIGPNDEENIWKFEVTNDEETALELKKEWDEASLPSDEEKRSVAENDRETNGATFVIGRHYQLDYAGQNSETICTVQVLKDSVVVKGYECKNLNGSSITVAHGDGDYSLKMTNLSRFRAGTYEISYFAYELPRTGLSQWSPSGDRVSHATWDNDRKIFTINATNTYHLSTNVRINKCWVDNDNAYSTRPQTISFDLYRLKKSSGSTEFVVDESFTPREVVLDGSKVDNNCWYEEVNDLDVATGGDEYKYEFQEKKELLEGVDYESSNNGSCTTTEQDGNCTVTNTLTGELEMSGTKTWIDDNDSQGVRPENLELILERATDGVTYEGGSNYLWVRDATPTWTKNGNVWSYKYSNLAKYDEQGRKYFYRVKEDTNSNGAVDAKNCTQENLNNCDKYVSQETGEENNFKNLLTGKVNYKGKKVWEDSEAPSDFRPEEITVNLCKNGVQFKTATVTASKDGDKDVWEFEFTDLDKYDDNGKLIIYTIDENAIDQYLTEINQTENTIYNTYNSEKTSVEARKVWKDDKESDRPGKIELTLMRKEDGEWKHYAVASLSKDNDWRYIFEDLDANYEYEILEEIQVPGYYPGVYRACEGDSSAPICYEVENRFIQPTPDTGERNPFAVLMFATPAIVFGGWFAARKLMGRR